MIENKKHKTIKFLGIKLKYKFYSELDKTINNNIKKYKYVHIMYNDKFTKPFVDFLNRHFDTKEHMVLCYRRYENVEPTLFPEGENVYEYVNLNKINLKHSNIEKIICHSLFSDGIIDKLYKEKNLLKKSYWVIWGGDLYNAPRDKKNDFVRQNFKGYIGDVDKNIAIQKYSVSDLFHKMFYKFPLTKDILDKTVQNNKDYIKIQINNSCDESTLDMLDILSKFKTENIKITTILSYGKLEYKNKIIQKGKKIFKDKFEFLENLLPHEDYAKYIAQNDILVLNQNRQQGLGNVLASLYLGGKIYIKKSISINQYLNNENIKVYNSEEIDKLNFEQFITYSQKEQNRENVKKFLDDEYLAGLLREVFNEN